MPNYNRDPDELDIANAIDEIDAEDLVLQRQMQEDLEVFESLGHKLNDDLKNQIKDEETTEEVKELKNELGELPY